MKEIKKRMKEQRKRYESNRKERLTPNKNSSKACVMQWQSTLTIHSQKYNEQSIIAGHRSYTQYFYGLDGLWWILTLYLESVYLVQWGTSHNTRYTGLDDKFIKHFIIYGQTFNYLCTI